MRTERLVFLGRGVAYRLASPQAAQLRRALAKRWHALLARRTARRLDAARHGPEQGSGPRRRARLLGTLQASVRPEPGRGGGAGPVALPRRPRGSMPRGFAFSDLIRRARGRRRRAGRRCSVQKGATPRL
jgi:hypothetical protein